MDLSNILTENDVVPPRRHQGSTDGLHPYPTRYTTSSHNYEGGQSAYKTPSLRYSSGMAVDTAGSGSASASLAQQAKRLRFELLLQPALSPQRRNAARLPMRVSIWPHDTTESIISTVKNFYGLYEGQCVSFEDKEGNTLIARHENFENDMTVFVRTAPGEYDSEDGNVENSLSPKRPRLGPPIQMDMPPPLAANGNNISRPSSRNAGNRSASPQSVHGRRGASVSSASKSRARPTMKARTASSHGSVADANMDQMHDDSDSASVTSSRKARNEILASAEISVDNIVEGGRRKRAKFDSSELPLFVPSQVPMTASVSSVSPQRRIASGSAASPFAYNNSHTFAYTHPLPSPQSHIHNDIAHANGVAGTMPYPVAPNVGRHGLRAAPARLSISAPGVLPTPDPTIGGSVISDEDVALQLMRLGDASNISLQGRTSTSTLNEDAYSGKAEIASSAGESVEASDGEDDLPYPRNEEIYSSGEEYEDHNDGSFKGESDGIMPQHMHDSNGAKLIMDGARQGSSSHGSKINKMVKPRAPQMSKVKSKTIPGGKVPISPSSLPPQSRKASNSSLNFQHQFGPDEEDLSSKPRCQRCRKSKKGCDRQRPCGRCKDAGIGIEGCVSEDEGNGRKGRYGRHMGVPVKKDSTESMADSPVDIQSLPMAMPPFIPGQDASKKRKR